MHAGWLAFCLGAWITSVVAVSTAASGTSTCSGRVLLSSDGSFSGLTDCELDEQLERAALRENVLGCVHQAAQAPDRVYGKLSFDLDLHPGGGVSSVRFERSAFRRTCLPDCLARTIRRRLSGPRRGKPAALHGKLTLRPGAEVDFGLSLSGMLAPPPKPKPRPLNGTFSHDSDGVWASCGLGTGRLFLRLDPRGPPAQPGWEAEAEPGPQIDACLALGAPDAAGPARKAKRLSARARKRRVTACLTDLLKAPDWGLRAQAAEELARGWRWRGRRAIGRAVEAGLRDPGCTQQEDDAEGKAKPEGKIQAKADEVEACPFTPPAGSQAGHALVRMLKAQLRLRRSPKAGVLDALARHPDARVRLRLVDTVLARWRTGVPEGLDRLVRDPDPLVRARAQQVGCQRADWGALRAFRDDLRSADPNTRAQSLLHARACADRSAREVTAAARKEASPVLALVMLRSVPVQDPELVLRRAGPALFDPCPLVRYLAARLLGRLAHPPVDLARQALAREPEPLIKRLLAQLSKPAGPAGAGSVEQLWLQAAGDKPRSAPP